MDEPYLPTQQRKIPASRHGSAIQPLLQKSRVPRLARRLKGNDNLLAVSTLAHKAESLDSDDDKSNNGLLVVPTLSHKVESLHTHESRHEDKGGRQSLGCLKHQLRKAESLDSHG